MSRARIVLLASLLAATNVFAADPPRAVWVKAKCALCHGVDGTGDTEQGKRLAVRDLRAAEVQKLTDDALGAVITNGRNRMPAFRQSLNAGQVSSLVLYIRELARK